MYFNFKSLLLYLSLMLWNITNLSYFLFEFHQNKALICLCVLKNRSFVALNNLPDQLNNQKSRILNLKLQMWHTPPPFVWIRGHIIFISIMDKWSQYFYSCFRTVHNYVVFHTFEFLNIFKSILKSI